MMPILDLLLMYLLLFQKKNHFYFAYIVSISTRLDKLFLSGLHNSEKLTKTCIVCLEEMAQ